MGNLGFTEIMIILLVVLLVFGAKRLPEIGASMGKGIREFKRSLSVTQDAIMNTDDQRASLPPRSPESAQPSPTSGEPKRPTGMAFDRSAKPRSRSSPYSRRLVLIARVVRIGPGRTALTVIPAAARSSASDFTKPTIAAFEAA